MRKYNKVSDLLREYNNGMETSQFNEIPKGMSTAPLCGFP